MGEELQTEFKREGIALGEENKEKENSSESSTENNNGDQTQSQEGENTSSGEKTGAEGENKDAGLANHPRWIERENDWKDRFNKQEERHTEELTKLRTEFEDRFSKITPKAETKNNGPVQIPSWFGGDEEAYAAYQQDQEALLDKAEQRGAERAIKMLQDKSSSEEKAVNEATEHMNTEIAAIESDRTINPDGAKVDKNKLLKFILDSYNKNIRFVDDKNRWDYRAAFEAMKQMGATPKTNSVDEKKKIAGASTSDNRAENKPQPFATSQDFEKPGGRPW